MELQLPDGFIKIPVTPHTYKRGKQWSKSMNRYHQWCKELRALWTYGDLPKAYELVFAIAMPKSWTKKRKKEKDFTFHDGRSDLDNYIKAFSDAICYGDGKGDAHIAHITASKFWCHPELEGIYYRPWGMLSELTLDEALAA